MKPNYGDITARLGDPVWWDSRGAPRYCAFGPDWCGVYTDHIAFMDIRCQLCGQHFKVAVEADPWERKVCGFKLHFPDKNGAGSFYYKDPPRHNCPAGETMTSDLVSIIEFWSREKHQWVRKPEYELVFEE